MTAKDYLNLILPVPAERFITNYFTNTEDKCCILGHVTRLLNDPNSYSSANCFPIDESPADKLRTKSSRFLYTKHNISGKDIASVNNTPEVNGYTEPVIKDRVVHFLKDMVEAGY